MNPVKFLILGGYGNTGIIIARLLLQKTDAAIILAGRNFEKAQNAATKLNLEFNTDRVSWLKADAADEEGLNRAFRQCSFVIVASGTAAYTGEIASAAIANSIDYLDVQFSLKQAATLTAVSDIIKEKNLCFITDAGFHPGLPAAMILYINSLFDTLESAIVSSLVRINWKDYTFSDSTMFELLDEIHTLDNLVYKNGVWNRINITDRKAMRKTYFGERFGFVNTYLVHLEELVQVPDKIPSLMETGFYVSGFNKFVDYFVLPAAYFVFKFIPPLKKPLARLLEWGLKKFSKPPFNTILKLEAYGFKGGKEKRIEMTLSHEDGYLLTAVPVTLCLMQYLGGGRKTGLHTMAHFIDAEKLFENMKEFGIEVTINEI